MKFLVDNALSPSIADGLNGAGFEASHVRDFGLATAEDETIFAFAARENYVVISADTDFGTLGTMWHESKPSIIILRRVSQRRPKTQVSLLLANLANIVDASDRGAIVVFDENRIRIRNLPIND